MMTCSQNHPHEVDYQKNGYISFSFFSYPFKSAFIRELGKKIQRLKEDPQHVGGWLHGKLHGKKSTRIANKYRLIFSIEEESHTVFLLMIDHREEIYHRK